MTDVRIGISSCLLGEQVRYDGGHKRDAFLTEELGLHVRYLPLCPEVEIGLGVPRPTIRLERRQGEIRLVEPDSGIDHTERMRDWSRSATERIAAAELDGYVLKRGSPSCGLDDAAGRGPFAEALVERLPLLAVEEEGRLRDARLREHFIQRVFGQARVREFLAGEWTPGGLVEFHSAEKMLVRAHDPSLTGELGRLVAEAGSLERAEVAARYAELHARPLTSEATPGRHQDVLEHLAGHVKDRISRDDRAELQEAIEGYRAGRAPRTMPLALLRRHLRAAGAEWAANQVYLQKPLMVVAIDGPAGAGKSTVARAAARALGFTYLDSGAMYRAVGLMTLRKGGAASEQAEALELELGDRVVANGEDVTEAIRAPEVSEAASRVATNQRVREALVRKQRELLGEGDWVAEGRDIGTVVAPDAALKVFLTADPAERARRRAAELGTDVDTVQRDQALRDAQDSTRAHSPLQVAPGSIELDTTGLTVDQVVERIAELVRAAR